MKKDRQVIFLMIVFSMLMVMTNFNVKATTGENQDSLERSGTSLALSRFEIEPQDKVSFYTGENIVLYAGFTLSENSSILRNPTLELRIPAQYIDEVEAPDFPSQTNKTVTKVGNEFVIRYQLGTIAGGMSLDIPFSAKTKNYVTPDGYQLPIQAALLDENDNPLIEPIEEVIPIVTKKPWKVNKKIICQAIENNNVIEKHTTNDGESCFGGNINPGDTHLPTNIEQLNPIKFQISLTKGAAGVGNRNFDRIIVEDRIPDGAVFIQAANPEGWSFNPDTRIARFEGPTNSVIRLPEAYQFNGLSLTNATLTLYFPGAALNTPIENTMSVTFIPQNKADYEDNITLSDDITFNLTEKKEPDPNLFEFDIDKINNDDIYDVEKIKEAADINYTIRITNRSRTHGLENIVIDDYYLNPALKFKALGLSAFTPQQFQGTINVIEVLNDTTERVVAENIALNSDQTIYFSDNVKSFRIETTDDSYLAPNTYIYFKVITAFKDPSEPVVKSGITASLFNYVKAKGNYIGATREATAEDNAYATVRKPDKPFIKLSKIAGGGPFSINSEVNYQIYVMATNVNSAIDHRIQLDKVVDILPVGFDYVAGSSRITGNATYFNLPVANGSYEPTVIENYHGSGRTALQWELFEPTIVRDISRTSSYTSIFYINYKTTVTRKAAAGMNENEAYLTVDNPSEIIFAGTNRKADQYDINGNGNTEEVIGYDSKEVRYTPPYELLSNLEVIGNLDHQYFMDPKKANGELATEAMYHLDIINNSVTDYDYLNILNVLPHIGDTSVSVDLSQNPPSYVSRNSEFAVSLTGPIVVLEGYKVYYTSDEPTQDMVDYEANAHWVETMEDYSQVKAYKIVMQAGTQLKSKENVEFYVPFAIPKDYDLDYLSTITNSYGVATTRNHVYGESNFATLQIHKYKIDGYAFEDLNKNGIFEEIEPVFKNHTVQLVDVFGQPILDLEGEPYITTTDDSGYFYFDVYRQGQYAVKIVAPAGYETTALSTNPTRGNHSGRNGLTTSFVLSPEHTSERRNAGFYNNISDLFVSKQVEDFDGNILTTERQFHFTVTINDVLYQGEALINNEHITITDGQFSLKANQTLQIAGLPLNAQYRIEEAETEHYSSNPANGVYTGILDQREVRLTYVNTFNSSKIDITMEKIWMQGPSQHPDILVQLYRNGQPHGEPVTLTNGVTTHTWLDLDEKDPMGSAYAYTVDEISVPENYKKIVEGFKITNIYVDPPVPIDNGPDNNLPNTGVSDDSKGLLFGLFAAGTIIIFVLLKQKKKKEK